MSESSENKTTISRREVLLGAGAVLAAAGVPNVFAKQEHHHGHGKYPDVVTATLDCIRTGEACLDHCLSFFKKGDTSMAECADSVNQMLAMCTAMQKLASHNSKYAAEMAMTCVRVCKDCELACNKHAKKHEVCRACADACKDCIRACKQIAA